jgi:hypothetical protein
MPKPNVVAVGAKLDMNNGFFQTQEDCEYTILQFMQGRTSKIVKQFEGRPTEKPEQYLEQSLKTVDPKTHIVYVKGLEQPGYLINLTSETEPRKKLQEDLVKKYLPKMFALTGLTPERITPLNEKEQEIVDSWFLGKK